MLDQNWLMNPVNDECRVLLLEVHHSQGIVRLATLPYMDEHGNPYDDWLTEAPVLDESLYSHAAVGDFQAINTLNPEQWASYHWAGYPCLWFWGDIRWPRSQFVQVAAAVNEDVRRDDVTFDFDIVDRGFLLEKTVRTTDDPVTFGYARNITPKQVDYARQVYQIHDGPVDQIPVIRDNGVPVSATFALESGQYTLNAKPVGTHTVDVMEVNDTAPEIVQALANRAGFEVVDSFGLATWQQQAKLGFAVKQESYAECLNRVATAIGAYWRLDGLGRIELVSDQVMPLDTTLTDDDLIDLQPGQAKRPPQRIELHYDPNPQTLSVDVLSGPVEAGVVSAAERQWLSSSSTILRRELRVMTGDFDETLVYHSHTRDAEDAELLLDLLEGRCLEVRRTYRGQIRPVAYGLRVGDRIRLNCTEIKGVALITRLTRRINGELSDVELEL